MKKLLFLGLLILTTILAHCQSARIRDLQTQGSANGSYYLVIDDPSWTRARKMTITVVNSIEAAARAAQDDVIEAGAGLNANGTYLILTGSNFLTNADFTAAGLTPNINNATYILDSILANVVGGSSSCYSFYIDTVYGCDTVYFDAEAKFLSTVRLTDDLVIGHRTGAKGANSIVSGSINTASGDYSMALGTNNSVSNTGSFVGGTTNTNSNVYAIVYGNTNDNTGALNAVFGSNNAVGGQDNLIGGNDNDCAGAYSFMAGNNNDISAGSYNAVIGNGNTLTAGTDNNIFANTGTIRQGVASGIYSGQGNYIYNHNAGDEGSTIVGGEDSQIGAAGQATNYDIIAGGQNHDIATVTSVASSGIFAGETGLVNGSYSVIAGGQNNTVTASNAIITGGSSNSTTGAGSVIDGGYSHSVSSNYSGIFAGYDNTVSAGALYSMIAGGYQITAAEDTTLYSQHDYVQGKQAYKPNSITVAGSTNIVCHTTYIKVVGSGGAVTDVGLSSTNAFDGQIVILEGTNNTNTVRIDDGLGCNLTANTDFTLADNDMLILIFNSSDGTWNEISRSDN